MWKAYGLTAALRRHDPSKAWARGLLLLGHHVGMHALLIHHGVLRHPRTHTIHLHIDMHGVLF